MYGGYNAGPPQKKSSNLIIILVVLILILFTVGGIGLATKGTFSFSSSSSSTDNQYASSSSPTTTPPSSTVATDNETDNDAETDDSAQTGASTLKTDLPEITAAKLIEDYNAGDTYAGSIYGGKYYNISGTVKGYGTATTPVWIALGTAEETLTVECRFPLSTDKSIIGSLTVGESITIQGKINSYDLSEGVIVVANSQIVP